MGKFLSICFLFVLSACASQQFSGPPIDMDQHAYDSNTAMAIEVVSADDAEVTGEKADDQALVADEKAMIKEKFQVLLVQALSKEGFNVQTTQERKNPAILVRGKVKRIKHGAAMAKVLGGRDAGASGIITTFLVFDQKINKLIGRFDVSSSVDARVSMIGKDGFIHAHLTRSAEKAASILASKGKTRDDF